MSFELSQRVNNIKPSATLSINAKAKALKAEGKDIISLSVGEPDFGTPEHICAAAIQAIQKGNNCYTAVDGAPETKDAVIAKLKRDNQLDYQRDQIIIGTGGKQCIFNLLLAILNSGDEVIIPAPYWVSYPDMVIVNEGKPVFIKASLENHYKITADQLEQAITDKTCLFMFNSPSNPTGMAYNKAELDSIAKVLLKYPDVLIMSDDMYEHIWWADEPFCNLINVCPELYERTIIINAVSKAYAMTGWRLGFAAGPKEIIGAMKKIQGQSTSNPCTIAQKAAIEAFAGDQSCLQTFLNTYKERYEFVYKALSKLPGFKVNPTDGAFYIFPNIEEACQKLGLKDDVEFTEHLLNNAGVAVVPGSAFGAPGSIRISYALDIPTLKKALSNIAKVL